MIKHIWPVYFLFIFILGLTACQNGEQAKPPKLDPKEVQDHLAKIHKQNIKVEDRQIDDYLERRGWKFNRTKSGLRYKIYKEGIGIKPQEGQRVKLEYTLNLIRGDVVYDSKKDGPKIFVVGEGDEPTGLHEVVQLMRVGSRAKVILPSYLAYGLIGDEHKIPPSATLFYDLYLVEVH
jgi:FKBP-type peptidyl-prolyl cis-trans isomerase